MTPSVQNLNAKLSPRPRGPNTARLEATNRHLARAASSARARKASPRSRYRGGGYLVDC
jgi:hypothetical protein